MQQKYKVLLIGSIPPPYHGSNICFYNLLFSKIKEEFDVYHLDTSDHRNLDNLNKLDFINVYIALKNITELIWMLLKVKPSLVYIPPAANFLPYFRDGLFILCTAYFSKAKIIVHLHGGNYFREEFYDKSNFLIRFFVKWTLKKVDTAIVLGDCLKSIFNGLVENTIAIPNGTNFGLNFPTKKSHKQKSEKFLISFLGNLYENKGVLDVLEASIQVLEKHQNVKFQFAGSWWKEEPETQKKAYQLIERYNFQEKICFCGIVNNIAKEEFLKETDIFVFPSWKEGFPLVIIEAMSAGCPVVTTKGVGAIQEIVVDSVTGLLVDQKKPKQIADAIIKLIDNPQLRQKMGIASRKRFERNYTIRHYINRMTGVFKNTLKRKN
jgi:glycosyltransferase involved in cell wall biosynthesis